MDSHGNTEFADLAVEQTEEFEDGFTLFGMDGDGIVCVVLVDD